MAQHRLTTGRGTILLIWLVIALVTMILAFSLGTFLAIWWN